MDLSAALSALVLVIPVELPDKTFVATLVLATRYPPFLVWIGVGLAFGVQTAIAVTLGGLLARLPTTPVAAVAAVLFAVGAVVLWRSAARADADEAQAEEEFGEKVAERPVTGVRVVATSFAVLFLAEWGDLSQLLTAGLAARTGEPLSVFVGAWLGLLLVSGAAALLGRTLLARVRLSTVRRIGAGVCALLAVLTTAELLGAELPF